jgi:hypothetical protein
LVTTANGLIIDYLEKELQNYRYTRHHKIIEIVNIMSLNKETAEKKAKEDLANRLNIKEDSVKTVSVDDKEFSDMSLGAAVGDEMSAQMISYGYQIKLVAEGKTFEYRGDKYQLRLVDFEGSNYMIESY